MSLIWSFCSDFLLLKAISLIKSLCCCEYGEKLKFNFKKLTFMSVQKCWSERSLVNLLYIQFFVISFRNSLPNFLIFSEKKVINSVLKIWVTVNPDFTMIHIDHGSDSTNLCFKILNLSFLEGIFYDFLCSFGPKSVVNLNFNVRQAVDHGVGWAFTCLYFDEDPKVPWDTPFFPVVPSTCSSTLKLNLKQTSHFEFKSIPA